MFRQSVVSAFLMLGGSLAHAQLPSTTTASVDSSAGKINIERLASGLEFPWALAVLPHGAMRIDSANAFATSKWQMTMRSSCLPMIATMENCFD